jgi:uncharacterized membrane protein YoaK (UPF0700 family)
MAGCQLGGLDGACGEVFSQWISGQPWWLTVLMLPVWLVLACIGFVLKQLALAALILAGAAGVGVLAWRLHRRAPSQAAKPGSKAP